MQKKLTITIDNEVYNGLYDKIGKRKISHFIESLIKPHVLSDNYENAYRGMSRDESREKEAIEWNEGLIGDIAE